MDRDINYGGIILSEIRKELKSHGIYSRWDFMCGPDKYHDNSDSTGLSIIWRKPKSKYVYDIDDEIISVAYQYNTASINVIISSAIPHKSIHGISKPINLPCSRLLWSFELAEVSAIPNAVNLIKLIYKVRKRTILCQKILKIIAIPAIIYLYHIFFKFIGS